MKELFVEDNSTGVADAPQISQSDNPSEPAKRLTITDGQLLQSMRYNAVLGCCCLIIFGVLSSSFKMYRLRSSLRRVTEKPPSLPRIHYSMFWMWIWRTLSVSDEELLLSAGLDALMLVKTFGIGIQLFFPMAIIGSCLCACFLCSYIVLTDVSVIPLHKSGTPGDYGKNDEQKHVDAFVKITASNVEPGSTQLWIHFACVYAFILYALLLFQWHLKRYVRLRHRYLSAGGELNLWRTKHFPEASDSIKNLHHVTLFHNLLSNAAKLFSEDNSDDNVKKGLLSRLATFRKDETQKVIADMQRESEDCRAVPEEDESREDLEDDFSDNTTHTPKRNQLNSGEIVAIDEEDNRPTASTKPHTTAASLPSEEENQIRESQNPPVINPFRPTKRPIVLEVNRISFNDKAEDDGSSIWKWWLLRDNVTEIHSASALSGDRTSFDLPRPSVRYLKTVNTRDEQGTDTSVNAQQYCVLLTNCPTMGTEEAQDRDESPPERHAWYSKLFHWFFREISVETVNLRAQFKTTMSKIGFMTSRSHEESSATPTRVEINKQTRLPPKRKSWNQLRRMLHDGKLKDAETNAISESFRVLFPNDFVMAHPIRNHKKIDLLVCKWERTMSILERYEERARRTGDRPLINRRKWWSFLTFCILGNAPPVDAITHYTVLVRELEREIVELRQKILSGPHCPSWLIIFRTQISAAIASQTLLHSERLSACRVEPAPGPDEINWQALWKTEREKTIRGVIVAPFMILLIAIPLGIFAGALSSLNNMVCDEENLKHHKDLEQYCTDEKYQNLLEGWVPPILVSLWQNMVMPNALYYLVQASSKCTSLSHLELSITELFFLWDVLNIFLGGLVGGSLVSMIGPLIEKPSQLMSILGDAVPASSNFFVNYITLRAFFMVPYQLLVPHGGIWHFLLRIGGTCGCARTSRDRALLWSPRSVRYGREYGVLLLIFLITLGYSVISPVIVIIAVVYFFLSWFVWRYQILYIFVRKYESGGRMWPMVVNRLLFCLWLFQFLTSCVLLTKEAYYQAAILLVTVPYILRKFYVYCDNRFAPGLNYIPLEMAHNAPPAEIDPKVYTPPALLEHCAGWHPEYMKAWEGWGSPGYTL